MQILGLRRYTNDDGLVIEAAQVTDQSYKLVAAWCLGQEVQETDPSSNKVMGAVNVPTDFGNVRASSGAYVVKADIGSFYTIGQRAFESEFTRQ